MSPARWLRLDVRFAGTPAGPSAAYGLTVALIGLGAASVQEEDGSFTTYFDEPADPSAYRAEVERTLGESVDAPLAFSWSWQAHEEWADLWRQGFSAHDIGARLRVRPPWISGEPSERSEIEIDPGVAFGTAEHGSTRSCLTLIDSLVVGGESVLDVGAGTGVLSIAALVLGATDATCVEIDAMACEALRENAARNGVEDRIGVVCEAFTESTSPHLADLVVCNMVSSRVLPILHVLAARTAPGGHLIVGGIQPEEVDDVARRVADAVGSDPQPLRVEDEGWYALAVKRD